MSTINYTYNVIVDRFRQFAAGHFQLRRFTHGEISQADLEKEAEWPWLHVKPRAINYSPGTRSFSFEIFISDLPRDKEDKTGYQAESITDCSLIFQDLINEIYLGNMFGDQVVLSRPVNSEPFVEQYTHTLTGVTGTIELNLDYDWSACSIPASWNYNTPTDSPSDGWGALQFIESLDQNGVFVSLDGDVEAPGNSYYYGTNASGVKGWYQLIDNVGITCEDLPECATIISIVDDIAALQADMLLKANTADLGAVAFSNDYNDLDNKPTIPDVSGYVPYTGATADVDLGTHDLTATQGTFATSGNPDTLTVNHTSGSGKALTITKGGAGEGIYVNKTSGSGNAVTIVGDLEATTLKKTGGTSSQFLKADGSVDSSTYITGLTVGTTPITSGAVGRVLFEGTGNVLQESANLFWDNTNNKLGIGTTNFVGSIRLAVNGQIGGATFSSTYLDLTGGTPELRGNSGINFYGAGGNHIWYGTSSAERMRLFANGNLAIGTTTDAGFKLDVNGTARVSGAMAITGDVQATNFGYGNGQGNAKGFVTQGVLAGTKITFLDTNAYTATTGNVTHIFVDHTGFNPTGGTGTFTALAMTPKINQTGGASGITRGLHIVPTLTAAADFRAIETTAGNVLFGASGTGFYWDNTNSRLGIGTASPSYPLHITRNTTNNYIQLSGNTNKGLFAEGNGLIAFDTSGNFNVYTGGVNLRATFFSGGNVGIGTSTDAGYKLDVNGTARVSGATTLAGVVAINSTNVSTGFALLVNGTMRASSITIVEGLTMGENFAINNNGSQTIDIDANNNQTNAFFRVTNNGTANELFRCNEAGNFMIGTNTEIASSKLTVTSTTQGFLPPRMTTTEKNAIASPASGLVVYDTTLGKLCVRGAAAWETITSV